MGQTCSFVYPAQWISEGSTWRPSQAITLRDEAGVAIGNAQMSTMVLTLYDPTPPDYPIVAGVDEVNILNTRGCTVSAQGVFVLTLQGSDTAIVDVTKAYEPRVALVQYTYAGGAKSDSVEIHVIIRNIRHRP